MDNKILISVIIPTYGSCVFLREAIESILKQTFEHWELIVVDDNDPDSVFRKETECILNNYLLNDTRIKYIKHDYNRNGAVARNTGFAVAQGKYISLLDSDDEYLPNRLKRCYEEMEVAPGNVAGVYTGCEFRRGGETYYVEERVPSGSFMVETLACKFMFCTGSNIFVRKSVVDELNGFDPKFLRHQDYEFLVRVFQKYSLIGIPETLVVKNNENVNVPDVEKLANIKTQYLEKFKNIINNLSDKEVSFIYQSNYIEVAETAMSQNKFRQANEYYKKARQYGNLPMRIWFRRIVFPLYNMLRK